MFSIGISELVIIALVFVLIIKPDDYKDIILAAKKLITIIFRTKSQISQEINKITDAVGTISINDEIINSLADGELTDDTGTRHKFYKLDNVKKKGKEDNANE